MFNKEKKILSGDRVKTRSYLGNILTSVSGSWTGFTKKHTPENSWSFELLGRKSLAGAAFAHYIGS